MLVAIFSLMLLLAAAVIFLFRKPPGPMVAAKPTPINPYCAVELVIGPDSCAKARILAGSHLLSSEAPVLPIDGCNRQCLCSYRRHEDRRSVNRRRGDDGLPENFIYAAEENRQRNRRAL